MSAALAAEPISTPVPTAEILGGVSELETWARSLIITNQPELELAAETIKGVKRWRNTIVAFFADSKAKAHAAHRAIVTSEKSMTDKLDAVETVAKSAMLRFQQEQERKRYAEQARLQAEADRAARIERERLEAQAAKLKTPEKREERLEMAAAVSAPVIHVAPTVEKVAGVATRTPWRYRVEDPDLVPRQFLQINDKALAGFATSTKGQVSVPGVAFYSEQTLAIGGR